MLRLAIGTRSQLCQVLPGFRIVVIVDRREAYQNLDLPLLNRFEKQMLTAREVLTSAQKAVVDDLMAWCMKVMDDAELPSLQEAFVGFHMDTLPSLVIAQWPLIEELGWASNEGVKRILARIAHPIAVSVQWSYRASSLPSRAVPCSTWTSHAHLTLP